MPRAATHAFSRVGSETRSRSARSRVGARCASSRRLVDAGHRQHARGAAPVEQRHERHAAVEPLARALGLEAHERGEPARRSCPAGTPPSRASAVARRDRRGASVAPRAGDQPEAPQVLARAGRRGRSRASSRTSRRMFVSCSATPRSSASPSPRARSAPPSSRSAEDRQAHAPDRAGDAPAVERRAPRSVS